MADTQTPPDTSKLGGTIKKHKGVFIAIAVILGVVVVYFLYNHYNNSSSNQTVAGSNAAQPSGYAVPGPAGPTGPAGPRGPRGPRGPNGHNKRHKKSGKTQTPATDIHTQVPARHISQHTAGMPVHNTPATAHRMTTR